MIDIKDLKARLQVAISQMDGHQSNRYQGRLLIESLAALQYLTAGEEPPAASSEVDQVLADVPPAFREGLINMAYKQNRVEGEAACFELLNELVEEFAPAFLCYEGRKGRK